VPERALRRFQWTSLHRPRLVVGVTCALFLEAGFVTGWYCLPLLALLLARLRG
jgi:hypothetical protein